MKKTRIALLVASFALTGLLAGCTSNTTDGGKGGNTPDGEVTPKEGDEDAEGEGDDEDPEGEEGDEEDPEGGEGEGGEQGGEGEGDSKPAGWLDELPAEAGAIKRGDYYFALPEMQVDEKDTANKQYGATAVELESGDELMFFVNGTQVMLWAPTDSNVVNPGNEDAIGAVTVNAGGTLGVYLKHYNEDAAWVIYISGQPEGQGEEGGEELTAKYGLIINDEDARPLSGGEKWDMDPTFTQYQILGVELEEGDHLMFYDYENKASWGNIAIDEESVGSFSNETNYILVGEAGTFDIYVKLKFQNDNVYFGYSNK